MRPPIVLLALIACCGCERPASVASPLTTRQQCTYEIVPPDRPEQASTAEAFRAWLKPQAEDLFGSVDAVDNGSVFVADLDNDGTDEVLFALHEGSGSFLNATIFRRDKDRWSELHPPFEDRLTGSHEYRGTGMTEPQLVARLCGKTILNFRGGTEPNYYPQSLVWEDDAARPMCIEQWLTHHRAAAADLVNRGMLDEAVVLLNGIHDACAKEPAVALQPIRDEISRIGATTAGASTAGYDFSWLMHEIKTNRDRQLVLDPKFSAMLVAIVPNVQLDHQSFRGALKKSLWLPDDPEIIDDRYVVIAGCEPHNCTNRGVVWIDTAAKQAIGLTGGVMASRTIDPSNIPNAFWTHTQRTLADWPLREWTFLRADGTTTPVKAP